MSTSSEMLQRVRRIETRLTQLMIGLGVDTITQSPIFEDGDVFLPSPHTSLKEVLDNIPATWDGPVRVFVGDELVATLDSPGNRA